MRIIFSTISKTSDGLKNAKVPKDSTIVKRLGILSEEMFSNNSSFKNWDNKSFLPKYSAVARFVRTFLVAYFKKVSLILAKKRGFLILVWYNR